MDDERIIREPPAKLLTGQTGGEDDAAADVPFSAGEEKDSVVEAILQPLSVAREVLCSVGAIVEVEQDDEHDGLLEERRSLSSSISQFANSNFGSAKEPAEAGMARQARMMLGEMANSRPGGKRERLVASATELVHSQGVHRTTLAEVAALAEVPLGNVYYYFKTRDDLVNAVIEQWKSVLSGQLDHLGERATPQSRLKGLAELWTASAEMVATDGCPLGGLSHELNKCHDALSEHASELQAIILDFAEAQFRALRLRDPRGLAVHLLSGIQGAALLANTFDDPALLRAEVRRLERWIDELA